MRQPILCSTPVNHSVSQLAVRLVLEDMGLQSANRSLIVPPDMSPSSVSSMVDGACTCGIRSNWLRGFVLQEGPWGSLVELTPSAVLPLALVIDTATQQLWDDPHLLRGVLEQQRRAREQVALPPPAHPRHSANSCFAT